MIKARYIPHYIIVKRNMFDSKMTETMSKEIVDVLSKYNTTHIFQLGAFEQIFKLTHYNNALLKGYTLQSTIMASFNSYIDIFTYFVVRPSVFWESYLPHNATESLLNYVKVLQHLNKRKERPFSTLNMLSEVWWVFCTMQSIKNQTKQNFYLHQSD
jgi:hypothetical protein